MTARKKGIASARPVITTEIVAEPQPDLGRDFYIYRVYRDGKLWTRGRQVALHHAEREAERWAAAAARARP